MGKVEILQVGPYPAWDQARLDETFKMRRYFEAADKQGFLREHGAAIRGIATRGELGADREMIAALPNLEIISVYGVGFDAVDLDAARARGVRVTNTPDVLTKDVADLGVAMMLAQARQIVAAQDWVVSGKWAAEGLFGLATRVHGKRAGVLGLGRIGFEVAKRVAAFDMEVGYTDLAPRDDAGDWRFFDNPVALADYADFLFVTLTANAATAGIVDKQVLAALGPTGMLINISRAANIDEAALLDALEAKSLGAAALDVFDGEPDINPRFHDLDNVLLQPHHASGTVETRQAMGRLVFDNLVANFEGRDLPTPVL